MADSQRLNYPTPPTTAPPINFVLTEFHVLLLYPNRVIGVSVLNQSMVFEDFYSEVSHLISGGTVVAPLYNAEHPFIQAQIIQVYSDTLYRRERVAPCVPVSMSISRHTLYYNNSRSSDIAVFSHYNQRIPQSAQLIIKSTV